MRNEAQLNASDVAAGVNIGVSSEQNLGEQPTLSQSCKAAVDRPNPCEDVSTRLAIALLRASREHPLPASLFTTDAIPAPVTRQVDVIAILESLGRREDSLARRGAEVNQDDRDANALEDGGKGIDGAPES